MTHLRIAGCIPLMFSAWLVMGAISPERCNGQDQAKLRKYEQGPLTKADFTGDPPSEQIKVGRVNILALTYCDIRYTYRFRTQSSQGRWTSQAEQVDFFSVFIPEKSWNTALDNKLLLDHEQGHFDLTEVYARRVQGRIFDLYKAGKLKSVGGSEQQAVDSLVKVLEVELKKGLEELAETHKRYDADTENGSDEPSQGGWRKKINADLKAAEISLKKKR